MIKNKTILLASLLLLTLCNCFGMEFPKDRPFINDAQHAALLDTITTEMPNDEEVEALFNDVETLLHDQDLAQEIQEALPGDEKIDSGNGNQTIGESASITNFKKRSHTQIEDRLFACDQCNHSYAHKGSLARHMRTHTGEKPFKCYKCDYSCAYSDHLTTHMRTHTGEKKFKCSECNRSFAFNSTLQKHILTHSDKKTFSCDFCGKSFKRKDTLQEHLKTKQHSGNPVCHLEKTSEKYGIPYEI